MEHYIGSTEVDRIYIGNTLFYEKESGGNLLPVQNGLVCWLNGCDSGTGNTWLDKSGNENNATLSDYIRDEKFVQINGYALMPNATKNLTNYTIEFHYETITDKIWNSLFTNRNVGNNGYCLNLNEGAIGNQPKIQFYNGEYVQAPIMFDNLLLQPVVLTIKVETTETNSIFTFYKNGVKYDTLSLGLTVSISDIMAINTRSQNNGASTFPKDNQQNKWYSFKVYNRLLSDSEIQQNYEYEQSITRG